MIRPDNILHVQIRPDDILIVPTICRQDKLIVVHRPDDKIIRPDDILSRPADILIRPDRILIR